VCVCKLYFGGLSLYFNIFDILKKLKKQYNTIEYHITCSFNFFKISNVY